MNQDGSTLREIDRFLALTSTDPVLHRDFASVELGDIKQGGGRRGGAAETSFAILCSSHGGKGPVAASTCNDAATAGNDSKEPGEKAQNKRARGSSGQGTKEQSKQERSKPEPAKQEQPKPDPAKQEQPKPDPASRNRPSRNSPSRNRP